MATGEEIDVRVDSALHSTQYRRQDMVKDTPQSTGKGDSPLSVTCLYLLIYVL